MKTLCLLRHAKSSWDDASLDDFHRPLAPRGRRDAPRMAEYLAREGLVPDRVLCSPARRTVETWERMREILGDRPLQLDEALYLAGPARILDRIAAQDDAVVRLLVLGHNPGTERLAARLAAQGAPEALERMARKYPTAALAVFELDVARWSELPGTSGRLERFVRPKDL